MYDKGKVMAGLVIFLGLALLPILYNMGPGDAGAKPVLKPPPGGETQCVEDKAWMRGNHMQLIMNWREEVVRGADRTYKSGLTGKDHNKSLTGECLSCHSNKENFCDQCHNYLKVKPYCWDCHIVPKEDA